MLNGYLYPLIMLCCLSSFLGTLFNNELGFESFYYAMVRMGVLFATLFFTYHLSAYFISRISAGNGYYTDRVSGKYPGLCFGYFIMGKWTAFPGNWLQKMDTFTARDA